MATYPLLNLYCSNAYWLQKRFFTDFSKVYSDIVCIGYHIKSSDIKIKKKKKYYSETVLTIISDKSVDCQNINNCLDLGAQRDLDLFCMSD